MNWFPFLKPAAYQTIEPEPLVCADEDNRFDQNSGTWKFIKDWAETELEAARKRNDSILMTPEKTAALRGEIKAWKTLANLPEYIQSRENRLKRSTPPATLAGDEDDE